MDIIQLYQDYSVDYVTEGHKHARPGWVNTECPWCTGNPGYHLGYNLDDDYYVCWRCGAQRTIPTLSLLLGMSEHNIRSLLKQYTNIPIIRIKPKAIVKNSYHLPSCVGPLQSNHKRYLEKRKFDPERIAREWSLLGTGPVSKLGNTDYKHRIIIPFIWDGRNVSFDSRDITGKDPGRYKACPAEWELIPHKSILYGKQEAWKSTGILVEGPTDVWRMGTSSFAVSGIKYTNQQIREIFRVFKRVAVMFDDDPQAKLQAAKIVAELRFRGVDAFRVDIEGDPGSMKQEDADYLVKQLIH